MAFEAEIESIRRIKADILGTGGKRLLTIAFDLSALIKLRIQTKGENAAGAKFVPYTALSKQLRKAAGYQIAFVDFTQTGQLWASVGPRLVSSANAVSTVVIESRNARGKEILDKAGTKRGNIREVSESETKIATDAYREGLIKLIRI